MKKSYLLLALPFAMILQEAGAQTKSPAETLKTETASGNDKSAGKISIRGPISRWDRTTIDFGDIAFNVPKSAEFVVTNDGNEPLIIASAQASCGCTNLKYEKDPILPKKSTVISVTYNAAAKGNFMKTVTVRTNAGEEPVFLQIKGNVLEK